MLQSLKPLARTEGLVMHEMPGELLVYDIKSDKAHCLNATSASVWKACDGARTVADLSALFDAQAGRGHSEGVVLLALEQFQQNNLLQNSVDFGPSYSRRDLIRTIGLTSLMVLPGVATLAMPKAPQASCQCVTPGDCLAQSSCPSMVNCNGSGICAP